MAFEGLKSPYTLRVYTLSEHWIKNEWAENSWLKNAQQWLRFLKLGKIQFNTWLVKPVNMVFTQCWLKVNQPW